MDNKRTAEEAGFGDAGPNQKSFRVEDMLESMDLSVRIKLRSLFDEKLLLQADLDDRMVEDLKQFDAATALEILENYSQADFSIVRNKRAYLAGAIKRKLHLVARPVLHPDVQAKLNQLSSAGNVRAADLDKRCMETLATLHPAKACSALDRYSSRDFSDVRNPSALFMSIVRALDGSSGAGTGSEWGDRSAAAAGTGGYSSRAVAGGYGREQPPPPPGSSRSAVYGQRAPPPVAAQAPASVGSLAGLAGAIASVTGQLGAVAPAAAAVGPTYITTTGQIVSAAQLQQAVQPLQLAPGTLPPGTVIASGGIGQPQYVVYAGGAGQGGVLAPAAAPIGATILGAAAAQPGAAAYAVPAAANTGGVPPGVPPEWAAGKKQYGAEQGQLGVRITEFHQLSPFAVFVHPSPAMKLQQLWDDGNELVSMLDDKVWQVLAELPAPEALAVIAEAGDALANPKQHIRNINAYLMSVVRKVAPHGTGHVGSSLGRAPPGRGYDSSRDSYDSRGSARGGSSSTGGYRTYREDSSYRDSNTRSDRSDRGGGGYRGAGGAAEGGSGSEQRRTFARGPAIHLLPAELRVKAEELCKEHAPLLRDEHFDAGVVDTLQRLTPDDAMHVLEELGQNSMAGVRNLPAYIMGICKRYGHINRDGGAGRAPRSY